MHFSNVIIPTILAGIVAQGLKIAIFIFKHKKSFHVKDLIVTGSMPSSHSALVMALTVSIALYEGFNTAFVISLILALIVIRDAFGVRREAGEEGKMLNRIIEAAKLKLPEEHYALGHTPLEVTVGVIIGVLAAVLTYFIL
jgi:acid phosphatase family membrane protein YuiD